ncbi:helix-turn-helix domain-containing protein [Streptomyces sp. DSM 44915]|uniref:Helix-turn-helix domain-containing protein n=1 Tax=Streptomyces chisholmiae TaxID=3075540 RepID=A0ABU2JTJ8_9ACTN|nr:helix-turn-helix domain-containing protein [Streptomyces sp. DSM 44915]MDT0268316.1 helix-turn-helix domain-containing protein [Streptomyces sp. DSM 44915]
MQFERTPDGGAGKPVRKALRVKEIANVLGLDVSTVYREIQSGRLPAYRVGTGRGTLRVTCTAFRDYLSAQGIPASELGEVL